MTAPFVNGNRTRLVAIAVGVGLVVLLVCAATKIGSRPRDDRSALARGLTAAVEVDLYQAVFLPEGRVFFGHLRRDRGALVLSDVYYASSPTEDEPTGRLVRRGAELHGPPSPMAINPEQVLFVENVSSDSDIAKAIGRIGSGRAGSTTTAP